MFLIATHRALSRSSPVPLIAPFLFLFKPLLVNCFGFVASNVTVFVRALIDREEMLDYL